MNSKDLVSVSCLLLLFANILDAGESRLEKKTHYSPVLGINKDYFIYLPEGYDDNLDERYPVVYLFRGHESEWTDPEEDYARNGRNIKILADQLYSQAKIGRMIFVMPGTMIHEGGLNTFGLNLNFPQFVDNPLGLGTGQYEDYFIRDLITHIDTTCRTVAKGTHRGTDGFSAGGWPALVYATKYPDMFSSVGAYDGAITDWLDLNNPYRPGILDAGVLLYAGNDPWYGPLPRDAVEIMNDSPANLIYDADDYNLSHLFGMQFLLHTVIEPNDIGIRWMTPYIDSILESLGMDNTFNPQELSLTAAHNWFYADEHALITLPLHWEKFQNPVNILNVIISDPGNGAEISGDVMLTWSPGVMIQSGKTDIFYSRDGNYPMQPLATVESADSTYLWSTTNLPDGTRYRLRFNVQGRSLANDDTLIGIGRTAGNFTINNPVNAIPEVEFSSPVEAEQLSGEFLITWDAADADGEALIYEIEYSSDNGAHWQLLADQVSQNSYLWLTDSYENSSFYQLVVHANDGLVTGDDTSEVFTLNNTRIPAADKRITHISGTGTPVIQAFIVDPESIEANAFYRIGFNDSTYDKKVFNIVNITTGDTMIKAGDQMDGIRESDIFDGVRLLIKDYAKAEINATTSGWETGNSNLKMNIYLPSVYIDGALEQGTPYPADYRISVFNQISDSTTFAFNIPSNPVYFSVYNLTEDRDADFFFQDYNLDQKIGDDDVLYLIEKNAQNEYYLIWAITFNGPTNPVPPEAGDQGLIATYKPLSSEDVFEFEVINAISDEKNTLPLTTQLYQNYPNPFNPSTVISWQMAKSGHVELEVYNLLGQKVATLVSNKMNPGSYSYEFDAKSLASGVYYYQIKTGEFQDVKKMLLIK